MHVVPPGFALTYDAPCPGCGETACWEQTRPPLRHPGDDDASGPESYRIDCGTCAA